MADSYMEIFSPAAFPVGLPSFFEADHMERPVHVVNPVRPRILVGQRESGLEQRVGRSRLRAPFGVTIDRVPVTPDWLLDRIDAARG